MLLSYYCITTVKSLSPSPTPGQPRIRGAPQTPRPPQFPSKIPSNLIKGTQILPRGAPGSTLFKPKVLVGGGGGGTTKRAATLLLTVPFTIRPNANDNIAQVVPTSISRLL